MNSITMKAYAKINLGLDVLRRREDGYHEISTVMQSIDLYDTLTVNKDKASGIKVSTNLPFLPIDQRNLVYKAAALFMETLNIKCGLQLTLKKHVPVAAGLAGGSSDAAAALKALNILFETGLADEELKKLGVKLGADVPYCLTLGTVLSEGIGEILTPLKPMPACEILLVKPDFSVSTKYVYENLNLNCLAVHPDIPGMLKAIEEGSLKSLTPLMDNILQTVTIKDYPVLEEIKGRLKDKGALVSLMSGSGPTVFGIFDEPAAARAAYNYFTGARYGKQVFLTRPYQPEQL